MHLCNLSCDIVITWAPHVENKNRYVVVLQNLAGVVRSVVTENRCGGSSAVQGCSSDLFFSDSKLPNENQNCAKDDEKFAKVRAARSEKHVLLFRPKPIRTISVVF